MKEKELKPRADASHADPYDPTAEGSTVRAPATPVVSHQLAWYSDTLVGTPLEGQTFISDIQAGDTSATAFAKLDKAISGVDSKIDELNSGLTDYTVTCTSTGASGDYAATYTFYQSGVAAQGTTPIATINIGKDKFLSGGAVITATDQTGGGTVSGEKYVELVLQNSGNDKIYIAVDDLVDVYTGADPTKAGGTYAGYAAGAQAKVTVDSNNVITVNVVSGTIDTAELKDGAVTSGKLATDSVITSKIADGQVTSGKLATDSVTTAKIADGQVTSGKLATNAVSTSAIQDGAVTSGKIADDTITILKLNSGAVARGETEPWSSDVQLASTGHVASAIDGLESLLREDINDKISKVTDGTVGTVPLFDDSGSLTYSSIAGTNVVVDVENSTSQTGDYAVTLTHISGDTVGTGAKLKADINRAFVSGTLTLESGTSGEAGYVAANPLMTYTAVSGLIQAGNSNHSHGNITNSGAIGNTADLAVVTGTNGIVTTKSLAVSETITIDANGTTDAAVTAVGQASDGSLSGVAKKYIQLGNITHEGKLVSGSTAMGNKIVLTDSAGKIVEGEYDGTYNASTNKIATQSTITNAISGIDSVTKSGTAGGHEVKVTTSGGSVTSVVVTDNGHAHGSITNDGKISTGTAIASGDSIVFTQAADGSIKKSTITFSSASGSNKKALTQSGTWESFIDSSDISGKADKATASDSTKVATIDASGNAVATTMALNSLVTTPVQSQTIAISTTPATGGASFSGEVLQNSITSNHLANLDYVILKDTNTNSPYNGAKYYIMVTCGRLVVSGAAA